MGRVAKDLTGLKFGKLSVLSRTELSYIHPKRRYREAIWDCSCECGQKRQVRSSRLTSGQQKSCGCLKKDNRATIGPRLSQFKKKEGTASRGIYYHYKLRAKKKNIIFALTFEEFMELSQKPCRYCGRIKYNCEITPSKEKFEYNGVDRVDSKKGYILSNCVPCCGWCNIAKFDLSVEEFILGCKLVASNND